MIVKVNYKKSLNQIIFNFNFEMTDRQFFHTPDNKVVTSFRKSCYFILPDDFQFEKLHPDRLALAVLLCCIPFIGQRLTLSFPVSKLFSKTIQKLTNIKIPFVSSQILPCQPGTNPSLNLSMGLDSMAGLLIMPDNTVPIFLDRVIGLRDKDLYRKDCVYHGLSYVSQKINRKIYSVPTDMEYLRKTIGFMIDISVGVPSILLSNHTELNSIGYGYSIHHYEHYNNGKLTGHCTGDDTKFNYNAWNQIFQSTGLYLNMVTMGLTEIGTLKVVLNSPFKNISTGCMRGRINKPCYSCKKCYRKILLKYYLETGNLKHNQNIYNKLTKHYHHSIPKILDLDTLKFAYGFMLNNYKGQDPFLITAKQGLSKYSKKFKYLDKWYSGSQNCIDPDTYQSILKNLSKYKIEII